MLAGIALNPHTPVSSLKDIIQDVDLICLMSVNPGFGGQAFITKTFDKIKELKQLISETNSKAKIEVDGGVNIKNIEALKSYGADILVAGNAVFKSESPKKMIDSLHDA